MPEDFWLQKARTDVTSDPYTTSQGCASGSRPRPCCACSSSGGAARPGHRRHVRAVRPGGGRVRPTASAAAAAAAWSRTSTRTTARAACMSMQLDTCSLVCGWYEAAKRVVARRHQAERRQRLLARPVVARLAHHRAAERHGQLRAHLPPAAARGAHAALAGAARAKAVQRALRTSTSRCGAARELRMGSLDKGLVFVDCIARERDAPGRSPRSSRTCTCRRSLCTTPSFKVRALPERYATRG